MTETTYHIIECKDEGYRVEVHRPNAVPLSITGFPRKADAEAWIAEQPKPKPTASKRIPRPRDPLALAKLIGDIATGQVEDKNEDGKNASAANLGRLGGAARARALSPEKRAEIAKKAAAKRWGK